MIAVVAVVDITLGVLWHVSGMARRNILRQAVLSEVAVAAASVVLQASRQKTKIKVNFSTKKYIKWTLKFLRRVVAQIQK